MIASMTSSYLGEDCTGDAPERVPERQGDQDDEG